MSERILQDGFAKWLSDNKIPFFRQRMDKAATGTVGWPDFTICHQGRCLLIETKFEKGKLSTVQVFKHAELAKAGCTVHVCRDLEIACNLVVEWMAQVHDLPEPVTGKLIQLYGRQWRETPSGYVPV